MTLALTFLVAALAVGIHEAWSKKRGVLGWIVSIVASLAGAHAPNFGRAAGGHATSLIYVSFAGMMLLTLLGSLIALRIVNGLR
jgi:hypothetical protein